LTTQKECLPKIAKKKYHHNQIDIVLLCILLDYSLIIYYPGKSIERRVLDIPDSTKHISIIADAKYNFHILYPIPFMDECGFCQSIIEKVSPSTDYL
jgi:hypothetical protein